MSILSHRQQQKQAELKWQNAAKHEQAPHHTTKLMLLQKDGFDKKVAATQT